MKHVSFSLVISVAMLTFGCAGPDATSSGVSSTLLNSDMSESQITAACPTALKSYSQFFDPILKHLGLTSDFESTTNLGLVLVPYDYEYSGPKPLVPLESLIDFEEVFSNGTPSVLDLLDSINCQSPQISSTTTIGSKDVADVVFGVSSIGVDHVQLKNDTTLTNPSGIKFLISSVRTRFDKPEGNKIKLTTVTKYTVLNKAALVDFDNRLRALGQGTVSISDSANATTIEFVYFFKYKLTCSAVELCYGGSNDLPTRFPFQRRAFDNLNGYFVLPSSIQAKVSTAINLEFTIPEFQSMEGSAIR